MRLMDENDIGTCILLVDKEQGSYRRIEPSVTSAAGIPLKITLPKPVIAAARTSKRARNESSGPAAKRIRTSVAEPGVIADAPAGGYIKKGEEVAFLLILRLYLFMIIILLNRQLLLPGLREIFSNCSLVQHYSSSER
jgi:hypothetical protein